MAASRHHRFIAAAAAGVAACAVLVLVALLAWSRAAAPPPAHARAPRIAGDGWSVVAGPRGTLEVAAVAIAAPDTLVAAFRTAADGTFAAWRHRLGTDEWERVTDGIAHHPLALGANARGEVLVVHAEDRRVRAELWRDGAVVLRAELPGALPRSAVFDEDQDCWWLGGVVEAEGARRLVVRLGRDGDVSTRVDAPEEPWRVTPGGDFTGVLRRTDRFLLTGPASCALWEDAPEEDTVRHLVPLDAADPDLRLWCGTTRARPPDANEVEAWVAWFDAPVRLLDGGSTAIVSLRRAGRSGWTLLAFDDAGRRASRVDLPPGWAPQAATPRWLVTARDDLDEAGGASHLMIVDLPRCLAGAGCGQGSPAGRAREGPTLPRVSDPAQLRRLAAPPTLLVDARTCVGDVVRTVAIARARGNLANVPHGLVIEHAPTHGHAVNLARAIARQVGLRAEVVDWEGAALAGARPLGAGVCVLTGEATLRRRSLTAPDGKQRR